MPGAKLYFKTSAPITGRNGLQLVIVASKGGTTVYSACAAITSDPFTLAPTAVEAVPMGGPPCGTGSTVAAVPPGTYQFQAGLYPPGGITPVVAIIVPVTVANVDQTVSIDGTLLSLGAILDAGVTPDTGGSGSGDLSLAPNSLSGTLTLDSTVVCGSAGNNNCLGTLYVGLFDGSDLDIAQEVHSATILNFDLSSGSKKYELTGVPSGTHHAIIALIEAGGGGLPGPLAADDLLLITPTQVNGTTQVTISASGPATLGGPMFRFGSLPPGP
jgi:hypothetical protein